MRKLLRRTSIVILLSAVGCDAGSQDSTKPGGGTTSGESRKVQVFRVVRQGLMKRLRLPGELLAYQDVALYPKVQGFVQSIPVDRGSVVKRGQKLVVLVAPEIVAQRTEAEAKFASDQFNFNRLKDAAATPGVVSQNDLDVAEQTKKASEARVNLWKEQEAYLQISAPFDGIITERNVHEGSLVGPAGGVPMLRVQQVSTLRLVVPVPEVAVGGVSADEALKFTVPSFPGESFTGVVKRLSHALDVKTRTMPVELEVDNASGRLSPGMFPEVQWVMKRPAESLFVPPSAVARTTERLFVIRIRNGEAEWIDVKIGATMGDLVEVFGGISEGDIVATRGTDELRAGTKVVPENPAPQK